MPTASASNRGALSSADWTTFNNKASSSATFTLGSTSIALGSTTTTVAGLASVTSTSFVGALSGNATTATTLQTTRAINGVNFDGSAAITITAAAGTLTGTTLNSTVVSSSLTSVGTIGTGVWQGTAIADSYISSASTWNGKQAAYTNLTSIGSLANASGWLKNNGTGTFSYSTPTKSDVGLGSVENTALSTWSGSGNITTVGTLSSGSIPYSLLSGTVPTWNQNTTGSATQWNGYQNGFSSGVRSDLLSMSSIVGAYSNGIYYQFNASTVSTFLGLGSMAYASTGSYLPLAGGTLTGALSGTTTLLSSTTSAKLELTGGTNQNGILFDAVSTAHQFYIGQGINLLTGSGTSADRGILLGYDVSAATAAVFYSQDGNIRLGATSSSQYLTINSSSATFSGAATFSSSVTASSFYESSDIRLKNIVERRGDMIQFTWKDGRDNLVHTGYSAQEVKQWMPTAVMQGSDGYLSVQYLEVHTKKINDLEKEVAELKKQIKSLKK